MKNISFWTCFKKPLVYVTTKTEYCLSQFSGAMVVVVTAHFSKWWQLTYDIGHYSMCNLYIKIFGNTPFFDNKCLWWGGMKMFDAHSLWSECKGYSTCRKICPVQNRILLQLLLVYGFLIICIRQRTEIVSRIWNRSHLMGIPTLCLRIWLQ